MKVEEYRNLTDEEKEELLQHETNDIERMNIIRSFSTDELMLKYAFDLPENERAGVSYSLTKIENKLKIIDSLTDEKIVATAIIELPSDIHKIKLLKRIKNQDYKLIVLKSIKRINDRLFENN